MLKWFCLTAVGLFILNPMITEAAFSSLVTSDYQYPEVPKSKVDVPICYIQTVDGRILNLQKLCNEVPPGNNNAFPDNGNSFSGENSSSQDSPETPRRRFGTGAGYASDHG